ncbi:MAG: hypothetical protein M0Z49_12620 [Chloroflexi bacterium]|nr:hypothetical protein [Chloroflexota bacterium]
MSVLTKIPVDLHGREWIRQLDMEAARRSGPTPGMREGQAAERRERESVAVDRAGVTADPAVSAD